MSIQFLCQFFIRVILGGLFVFLLSYMSSLYILDINSLSDTWFENIISHPIDCLFTVDGFLCCAETFRLLSPTYLFLLLLPLIFMSSIRNHHQDLFQGDYHLWFFPRSLMVSSFTFSYLIHFYLTSVYGVR